MGLSLEGNEYSDCAPDGPKWTAQNFSECRGGVGWERGEYCCSRRLVMVGE